MYSTKSTVTITELVCTTDMYGVLGFNDLTYF